MTAVANKSLGKSGQITTNGHRLDYWKFCQTSVGRMVNRSSIWGLKCDLTAYDIDELFIDQKWRCAVTNIPFDPPVPAKNKSKRHPFSPSIDRISSNAGYVKGNVRIVCTMVNLAMSEWGEEAFWRMVNTAERKYGQS